MGERERSRLESVNQTRAWWNELHGELDRIAAMEGRRLGTEYAKSIALLEALDRKGTGLAAEWISLFGDLSDTNRYLLLYIPNLALDCARAVVLAASNLGHAENARLVTDMQRDLSAVSVGAFKAGFHNATGVLYQLVARERLKYNNSQIWLRRLRRRNDRAVELTENSEEVEKLLQRLKNWQETINTTIQPHVPTWPPTDGAAVEQMRKSWDALVKWKRENPSRNIVEWDDDVKTVVWSGRDGFEESYANLSATTRWHGLVTIFTPETVNALAVLFGRGELLKEAETVGSWGTEAEARPDR